jgi:hypothetical protein
MLAVEEILQYRAARKLLDIDSLGSGWMSVIALASKGMVFMGFFTISEVLGSRGAEHGGP